MGGKTIATLAAGALALGGVGVAAVATEDSATSPDVTVQAQAAPPHPATESTGQYSATFHWGGVTEPGQTGYYVYQNGTQVADVTTPSYTFTGLDCGTTFTFGVAGHDGSGHTTPTSTTTYSTPACAGGGGGPTVNYYVAQSSAGSTNGSSCANTAAVTTLSTSTHWTAGNVIGLCGTISSPITAQGSGTSGNPITLYWTSGATLSAPTWTSPSVSIDGRSYITLDGGVNGSIQATAQGSGLAHQGTASIGVYAVNCSNCTIQNLLIENLYQHTSPSDTSVDQTQDNAIKFSGSNFTIANNTMHDMGWAIYQPMNSTDANVRIYGNNIYNVDHGWAPVANNFTGGNIGPYFFYDNHVHDEANWDTTTNAYHHDGIHCYTSAGGWRSPLQRHVHLQQPVRRHDRREPDGRHLHRGRQRRGRDPLRRLDILDLDLQQRGIRDLGREQRRVRHLLRKPDGPQQHAGRRGHHRRPGLLNQQRRRQPEVPEQRGHDREPGHQHLPELLRRRPARRQRVRQRRLQRLRLLLQLLQHDPVLQLAVMHGSRQPLLISGVSGPEHRRDSAGRLAHPERGREPHVALHGQHHAAAALPTPVPRWAAAQARQPPAMRSPARAHGIQERSKWPSPSSKPTWRPTCRPRPGPPAPSRSRARPRTATPSSSASSSTVP